MSSRIDVVVVGAGISGLSFAALAARAGRRVLVLEKEARVGGCIHTEHLPSGFWIELGAHTAYNSYGGFLELLDERGLAGDLQKREPPILRFIDGDRVIPGRNLGAVLKLLRKGDALRALPAWFRARDPNATLASHYGRLLGPRNYRHVLRPLFAAVTSQPPDDFPAGSLFKKRPRRKDILRSFTLPGGLGRAVDALASTPQVEVRREVAVIGLQPTAGGFAVETEGGASFEAPVLALAVPPGAATVLLRPMAPALASLVASIREAEVRTLAIALPASTVRLPAATFFVPLEDRFYSVVTRDVVPDRAWRGFTFHFRPDTTPSERRDRAARFLGVPASDLSTVRERRTVLPSFDPAHRAKVRAIDAALAGQQLALTGNWFDGLAIEDCVQRARREWERLRGA